MSTDLDTIYGDRYGGLSDGAGGLSDRFDGPRRGSRFYVPDEARIAAGSAAASDGAGRLSLKDLDWHLRFDPGGDADERGTVERTYLPAAGAFIEREYPIRLTRVTVTLDVEGPGRYVTLPYRPAVSLTSVYELEDGATTGDDLASDFFLSGGTDATIAAELHAKTSALRTVAVEHGERLRIVYEAGFSTLPEEVKQALRLMIGEMYEHRQESILGTVVAKLPMTAERYLARYREV